MGDIIYKLSQSGKSVDTDKATENIRWLNHNTDFELFNRHLELCDQKLISRSSWEAMYDAGTKYCGLFVDGKMVARAGVEKITDDTWEVSDVRVARDYRNNGYAKSVCKYVIHYILQCHKNVTIRTDENNIAMQRVIAELGFEKIDWQENIGIPSV